MAHHEFPGSPVREQRGTAAVPLVRVLLWIQACLFTLAWVLPVGFVVFTVATSGIPDDGSASWLLFPLFFAAIPFVLSLPGLVLAARFSRGRAGVRAGVIIYESIIVPAAAWVVLPQGFRAVSSDGAFHPFLVVIGAVALMGLVVLVTAVQFVQVNRP